MGIVQPAGIAFAERLAVDKEEEQRLQHIARRGLRHPVVVIVDEPAGEFSFQRLDIAKLTTDIASNFRSMIENSGLEYEVCCEQSTQAVYIDKSMWEKIVLKALGIIYLKRNPFSDQLYKLAVMFIKFPHIILSQH